MLSPRLPSIGLVDMMNRRPVRSRAAKRTEFFAPLQTTLSLAFSPVSPEKQRAQRSRRSRKSRLSDTATSMTSWLPSMPGRRSLRRKRGLGRRRRRSGVQHQQSRHQVGVPPPPSHRECTPGLLLRRIQLWGPTFMVTRIKRIIVRLLFILYAICEKLIYDV